HAPSGGIGAGGVRRRLRGPQFPSARCRWPAFALLRSCSSQFRFSRLKPTHVEALAGTVGALAATAALRDAAAWASEVPVPLAWRVSAGGGAGVAPLGGPPFAGRGVEVAPFAGGAFGGAAAGGRRAPARRFAGRSVGCAAARRRGLRAPAAALPPPRPARSRGYAAPTGAAAACSATAPSPTWRGDRSSRRRDSTAGSSGRAGGPGGGAGSSSAGTDRCSG